MAVKLDMKLIGYITTFENITKAQVKDVFEEENTLVFVVEEGQVGKAVGKGGFNVKKLQRLMKKPIKIIEFSNDVCKFVSNLIFPIKVKIVQEDDKIIIKAEDTKTKGKIFGREKSNLVRINSIVKKFYPVEVVVE